MGPSTIHSVVCSIFLFRAYDYVLCLACGLIAYSVSKVRPHCRTFSWTDPTINYDFATHGTFPGWTLVPIAVLPAVVYVVCEAGRHWWGHRLESWWHREQLLDARSSAVPRSPLHESSIHFPEHNGFLSQQDGHGRTPAPPSRGTAVQMSSRPSSPLRAAPAALRVDVVAEETDAKSPTVTTALLTQENEENERERVTAAVAGAAGPKAQGPSAAAVPSSTPGTSNNHLYSSPMRSTVPVLTNRSPASHPMTFPSSNPAQLSHGTSAVVVEPPTGHHMHKGRAPWQRFLIYAHMWVLTQAFSVTLTLLVVDTIKVYAGRLRPDFLSRLRRAGYSAASTDVDWCAVPKDGRVSFPSGHSGVSFAAFVPLSFYVLHVLRAFKRSGVSLWRLVVGLIPLTLPITVAVSRTRDNRHNFDDILAGSLIGIASALLAVQANMHVEPRGGHLTPRLDLRDL